MKFLIKKTRETDKNFPHFLKNIPNSPKELYFLGSLLKKDDIPIAIVGTRKATKKGLEITKNISFNLSKRGFTIVSGLAKGIDTVAHKSALKAGGKTIAVLANGLDTIYPKENKKLAKEIILQGGGIISEYPEKTELKPYRFLERNRIVSGISIAVLIIEAPIRSGTLSTANHGLKQGKEIFVIPGSVDNINYQGSHKLIRDGARLVTNYEDIIEDLKMYLEKENLTNKNQEVIL
jgi:DNA processing protein